jgi:epoxyqueuosine reductase QueG
MIDLCARIKALAGASTADAIEIAPGDAFSEEELGDLGRAFGPVRAVVVLAQRVVDPVQTVRYLDRGLRRQSEIAASFGDALLRDACWRVVEVLREAGAKAAIPRNMRYGTQEPSHRISYKKAGVLAGLGTFGRNQLLIHPEWGPWLHLRTVITDAPLPAGWPLTMSPCSDCDACLSACPSGALAEEGIDREVCRNRVGREGVPLDRQLSPFGRISCEECLRACPVGIAPPRLEVTK